MRWFVEIRTSGTLEAVVKRMGPFVSERQAEKVESGANINLNHEDYYTAVTTEEES